MDEDERLGPGWTDTDPFDHVLGVVRWVGEGFSEGSGGVSGHGWGDSEILLY